MIQSDNVHLIVIWTVFSVISPSNIVSISELFLILEIIGQCDAKHILNVTNKIKKRV